MRWGLAGVVIIGLHLVLIALSSRFTYGSDMLLRPIPLFVTIFILAGVTYLFVTRGSRETDLENGRVVWVVTVGLIIRLCAFASTPVLEDDYYRYLWDGGVLANGHNPYTFSPDEILNRESGVRPISPSLHHLAVESGSIVERVNHPHLRTIYPPVAQVFFALSHWIQPWSLFSWRLVLLGVDMIVLLVLIAMLRRAGLPITGCAIYWWNPLLVKEIFNSGHMDILIFPFVLGALWMAYRNHYCRSSALLAIATGVKIWPVVLMPLFLLPIVRRPSRLIPALATFFLLVGLFSLPVLNSGLDPGSGFTAYSEYWEMNDAFFMSVTWLTNHVTSVAGLAAGHERIVPRLLVFILFAAWSVKVTLREGRRDLPDLCERSVSIVAALFLLSPTQFPWYSLWFLPFLTIRPRTSLLLLTVLLPLYYLRFHLKARGVVEIFDHGIVWVEYVPVWIMLIREWCAAKGETGKSNRKGCLERAAEP
jgi:hypothetical protein